MSNRADAHRADTESRYSSAAPARHPRHRPGRPARRHPAMRRAVPPSSALGPSTPSPFVSMLIEIRLHRLRAPRPWSACRPRSCRTAWDSSTSLGLPPPGRLGHRAHRRPAGGAGRPPVSSRAVRRRSDASWHPAVAAVPCRTSCRRSPPRSASFTARASATTARGLRITSSLSTSPSFTSMNWSFVAPSTSGRRS